MFGFNAAKEVLVEEFSDERQFANLNSNGIQLNLLNQLNFSTQATYFLIHRNKTKKIFTKIKKVLDKLLNI